MFESQTSGCFAACGPARLRCYATTSGSVYIHLLYRKFRKRTRRKPDVVAEGNVDWLSPLEQSSTLRGSYDEVPYIKE